MIPIKRSCPVHKGFIGFIISCLPLQAADFLLSGCVVAELSELQTMQIFPPIAYAAFYCNTHTLIKIAFEIFDVTLRYNILEKCVQYDYRTWVVADI